MESWVRPGEGDNLDKGAMRAARKSLLQSFSMLHDLCCDIEKRHWIVGRRLFHVFIQHSKKARRARDPRPDHLCYDN